MKSVMMLIALVFSMSVFASTEMTSTVLETKEVSELSKELGEKGFYFLSIKDNFAEKGMFPRCPCSSYEISFIKHDQPKKIEKYDVAVNGFGQNVSVKINKVK